MILSRVRDVKQHLSRKHSPKLYCDRCKTIFPDEQSCEEHVAQEDGRSCTPYSQLDGILHQQQSQLSRKSNPKLSEEEQWFAIWDILFPDRPRPTSAYRDADISEELCSFREYCRSHGTALLDNEVQNMINTGTWSGPAIVSDEERRGLLRWALDGGLDLVLGTLRSQAEDAAAQSNNEVLPPTEYATPAGSGMAVEVQPPASHYGAIAIVGGAGVGVEGESLVGEVEPAMEGDQEMREPLPEMWPGYIQGDYQFPLDFGNFSVGVQPSADNFQANTGIVGDDVAGAEGGSAREGGQLVPEPLPELWPGSIEDDYQAPFSFEDFMRNHEPIWNDQDSWELMSDFEGYVFYTD